MSRFGLFGRAGSWPVGRNGYDAGMLLLDAAELAVSIFVYAMAGYFAFSAALWAAAKHNDWLTERRIAREVAEATRKGYPTLVDVMRLRA